MVLAWMAAGGGRRAMGTQEFANLPEVLIVPCEKVYHATRVDHNSSARGVVPLFALGEAPPPLVSTL